MGKRRQEAGAGGRSRRQKAVGRKQKAGIVACKGYDIDYSDYLVERNRDG
jgi:hypothetical protein